MRSLKLSKDGRKIDVVRPYLDKATGPGVVAIGVAQELQSVLTGSASQREGNTPSFSSAKADRRVTCCCLYVWDAQLGPGLVKVCAYFPYPAKVWVNGHEWGQTPG